MTCPFPSIMGERWRSRLDGPLIGGRSFTLHLVLISVLLLENVTARGVAAGQSVGERGQVLAHDHIRRRLIPSFGRRPKSATETPSPTTSTKMTMQPTIPYWKPEYSNMATGDESPIMPGSTDPTSTSSPESEAPQPTSTSTSASSPESEAASTDEDYFGNAGGATAIVVGASLGVMGGLVALGGGAYAVHSASSAGNTLSEQPEGAEDDLEVEEASFS